MIIKKWNTGTSTFDELYPKVTTAEIFTANGATNIFSGNKIGISYLPDAVFDSLYYQGALSLGTYLKELVADSADTQNGYGRSPKGMYWVATTDLTIYANASSQTTTYDGTVYVITNIAPADGDASSTTTANLETGDWIVLSNFSGSGTSGSPYVATFAVVNNTYEAATATVAGIVKVGSATTQSTAANAVTSTASRTYATQNNSSGQLVVNVPWTDTTYSAGTSTALGLIKLGSDTAQTVAANSVSATASRSYALQVNASGQGVVNVPWTDTTYSTATSSANGLVKLFSDTAQSVAANAVSATASRTYGVQLNGSGQMVVNVPWTDNDTTYTTATSSSLGLIKLGSDTAQTVAANTVSSTASRSYALQLNASGQALVNVPWTDTTYSAGEGITLSSTTFRETFPLYVQASAPTTTVDGAVWFDL